MGISLVDQFTGKFNISKYRDRYSSDLVKVIKAKAKGNPINSTKLKAVYSKSTDLMNQFKAGAGKRKKAS